MDKQISYCTLFFNCFMIYCSPIMDRKNENNIDVWKKEETAAFEGWDFSHLKGRWENEQLPWDYKTIISKYLRPEMQLLDLGTGGGEFLFVRRV